MFTVDKYLLKVHDMVNYNCWDFIREVWMELTGEDIGHRTPAVATRKNMRDKFEREEIHFMRIQEPIDPCLVMFLRRRMLPHVGVYYNKKVLHLPEKSNGKYQPLNIVGMGFLETRFYKCQLSS